MVVRTIKTGKWRQNCYVVADGDSCVIIDPGADGEKIIEVIEGEGFKPGAILNTHAHYDHIGAVALLKARYDMPFYMHEADQSLLEKANLYRLVFQTADHVEIPKVDVYLNRSRCPTEVAGFEISWLHTPGHTEGSVCFILKEMLFTGDLLLKGHIGRTDLPGGDPELLQQSLKTLARLPEELQVYAGHGGPTMLGRELKENRQFARVLTR